MGAAPDVSRVVPPAEAAGAGLFRNEALQEQREQWLGTVLVAPSVSGVVVAVLTGATLIAGVALLALGTFTQTVRVVGWLAPEGGIVRIYPPQSGRIVQMFVAEGDEVRQGEPLATVSTELESETLGQMGASAVERLRARAESLRDDMRRQEGVFAIQEAELRRRGDDLAAERGHLEAQIDFQMELLRIAEEAHERLLGLQARGLSTETAVQEREADRIRIASTVEQLRRDRLVNLRSQREAEARVEELPLGRASRIDEIERSIGAIEQEITETESRREALVRAPQDGFVTAVRGTLGGSIQADSALMNLVPAGSLLVAELFAPSRSIGFVRPGQPVLLRFQSFPYQKFGSYRGEVRTISRAAASLAELPAQHAGLAGLVGTTDPVYRIEVALDRQTVSAYGDIVQLQAGMLLEANVQIETRKLYEWALEPLLARTDGGRS